MKVSPVRPVGVREIERKRQCSHQLIVPNMLRIFAPQAIGLQVRLRDGSPKKRDTMKVSLFFGDPYGNRTHVPAVKGRCLDRLTNGPLIKYSESLAKPHTAYYCKHASQHSLSFDVVAVVGLEPTTDRV